MVMMGTGGREGVGVEGVVGEGGREGGVPEGGRAVYQKNFTTDDTSKRKHVLHPTERNTVQPANPPTRLLSAGQLQSAICF